MTTAILTNYLEGKIIGLFTATSNDAGGGIGKLSEMYPKAVIRYGSYRRI